MVQQPHTSFVILEQLNTKCFEIASSPEAGRPCEHLAGQLRVVPFRSYSIYYRFDLAFGQVLIERVL